MSKNFLSQIIFKFNKRSDSFKKRSSFDRMNFHSKKDHYLEINILSSIKETGKLLDF